MPSKKPSFLRRTGHIFHKITSCRSLQMIRPPGQPRHEVPSINHYWLLMCLSWECDKDHESNQHRKLLKWKGTDSTYTNPRL